MGQTQTNDDLAARSPSLSKVNRGLKSLTLRLGLPVEFGWAVMFEWNALLVRWFYARSPRQRRFLRSLQNRQDLQINFGCGDKPFPGWVNVDGVPNPHADVQLDLRQHLPFETGSARFIFSEHMVEHLRFEETERFLAECHRILQLDGAIRLVTPDLEKFARAYIEHDSEFFQKASPEIIEPTGAMNLMFRRGGSHHYIFDYAALSTMLYKVGFKRVYRSDYGTSAFIELKLDDPRVQRQVESLYVEAVK